MAQRRYRRLMVVWLYVFYRIGESFPLVVRDTGLLSIEMSVSRVGVIGVAGTFVERE